MPTENQPERASRANISYQTISLAQAAVVNGLQWQLYPVDFKTKKAPSAFTSTPSTESTLQRSCWS